MWRLGIPCVFHFDCLIVALRPATYQRRNQRERRMRARLWRFVYLLAVKDHREVVTCKYHVAQQLENMRCWRGLLRGGFPCREDVLCLRICL